MWKKISVYLLILFAGVLIGAGIVSRGKLSDIRESETAVVTAIAELERQSKELADSIRAVREGLNRCTDAVAAVRGELQQFGTAIQGLGTGVERVNRDVRDINTGQSAINAKLSSLGGSILDLGNSFQGLRDRLSETASGVHQASGELSESIELLDTATGILHELPKRSQ